MEFGRCTDPASNIFDTTISQMFIVNPFALTECETAGIKAGRPHQPDGTGGQSHPPGLCPVGS